MVTSQCRPQASGPPSSARANSSRAGFSSSTSSILMIVSLISYNYIWFFSIFEIFDALNFMLFSTFFWESNFILIFRLPNWPRSIGKVPRVVLRPARIQLRDDYSAFWIWCTFFIRENFKENIFRSWQGKVLPSSWRYETRVLTSFFPWPEDSKYVKIFCPLLKIHPPRGCWISSISHPLLSSAGKKGRWDM